MSKPSQLHIKVRREDDSCWATVDEFPGVFAAGDDIDELRESLAEGISLMLARPGQEPPAVTLAPLRMESEPAVAIASSSLIYA